MIDVVHTLSLGICLFFVSFHQLIEPGALALFISAVLTMLLVVTKRYHGSLSLDHSHGVQKIHLAPTPRVGGVAIFGALCMACYSIESEVRLYGLFSTMLIAVLPAFGFGLAEDLTKAIGVKSRLLATMSSGLLAWALTDVALRSVNLPFLDSLLAYTPLAVLVTMVAVAGLANSLNIIDGTNGLASGVAIFSLLAMALIAHEAGDTDLAFAALIISAALLGFMVFNFPFGKIFLGDGGAYLVGFLIGWIAVLLPYRNPEVSAWASLLACAYPVIETLYSMVRRHLSGADPGQPDLEHLHSLVRTRWVEARLVGLSPVLKNSAVVLICWPVSLVPVGFAVSRPDSTPILVLGFLCSMAVYVVLYRWLARQSSPGRL